MRVGFPCTSLCALVVVLGKGKLEGLCGFLTGRTLRGFFRDEEDLTVALPRLRFLRGNALVVVAAVAAAAVEVGVLVPLEEGVTRAVAAARDAKPEEALAMGLALAMVGTRLVLGAAVAAAGMAEADADAGGA